jgi:hypothetical protein
MGGMVLETNLPSIVAAIEAQTKIEKQENPLMTGIKDVLQTIKR